MYHAALVMGFWKDLCDRRDEAVAFVACHHPHATEATLNQVPEKIEPAFRFFPAALTGPYQLPIPVLVHAQRNVFNRSAPVLLEVDAVQKHVRVRRF